MSKPRTSYNFEINIIDVLTKRYPALTNGPGKELRNVRPIWSHDGKWIVYTQQHASGKNSNIFIADVVSGSATLLTPHSDEHTYRATAFSPDGKYLLITSNANGYDNVGLLEVASKKIEW